MSTPPSWQLTIVAVLAALSSNAGQGYLKHLPVSRLLTLAARSTDTKSLHEFVLEGLPSEYVANLRRRDQADKFLESECREGSSWGACGVLFTDKFETSSALKALSFRYRERVSCGTVQ